MAKFFLQEMVKVKQQTEAQPIEISPRKDRGQIKTENKNRPHRHIIWIVAIVAVVFLLFALSYFFSKAVVTVSPKVQDAILNENLSANKDSSANILPFDLVVISGEESTIIKAAEVKDLAEKAKGSVIIYNTFGLSLQRLDTDTRLEGSNGKIYKTETKTVVPGMAKDGTPGSVEVKIYGAEAGAEYNSAPLDFKIFGFKGTPKYAKFYARSKGEITGGIKGKFPFIPESQKESMVGELKNTLQAKLLKKAADQIPSGFILFKEAVFLDSKNGEIDYTSAKDSMLPVKLEGTLHGILFNEEKLAKKIAENKVVGYDGTEIFISNIRELIFSLSDKDSATLSNAKNINFYLSGEAKIVWKLDVDKLVADLLGKPKQDFNKILLQYPNVNSADLVLSPIWSRSIPAKKADVKIIVNYPK